MSAIAPIDINVEDIPSNQVYGSTNRRRVRIILTGTATAADTCNLATYVPGFSVVEIVSGWSENSALSTGTAITWSGSTLTLACTGTVQCTVIGYMA